MTATPRKPTLAQVCLARKVRLRSKVGPLQHESLENPAILTERTRRETLPQTAHFTENRSNCPLDCQNGRFGDAQKKNAAGKPAAPLSLLHIFTRSILKLRRQISPSVELRDSAPPKIPRPALDDEFPPIPLLAQSLPRGSILLPGRQISAKSVVKGPRFQNVPLSNLPGPCPCSSRNDRCRHRDERSPAEFACRVNVQLPVFDEFGSNHCFSRNRTSIHTRKNAHCRLAGSV